MKTKKNSTVILFLFLSTVGYSQTKKGTILLSGKSDLSFLFSKTTILRDSTATNTLKNNQFGFDIGVGYFLAVVGVQVALCVRRTNNSVHNCTKIYSDSMIKYIVLTTCFICFISICPAQYLSKERKQIIGTWLHEEGSWKFVFTSTMKCYEYSDNKLIDVYKYKLSNSSPQCGENVLVDESRETSYLELTSLKDGEKICYENNGFTSKTISLTGVGFAHPNLFIRLKKKNKSQPIWNLNGRWTYITDSSVFDILLNQKGNTIIGIHCSSMLNGNKLDCSDDSSDISINGKVIEPNIVTVHFKSYFSGLTGKATIMKISKTQVKWTIIETSNGEYYIPENAILTKK